jgi:hypothetical protein
MIVHTFDESDLSNNNFSLEKLIEFSKRPKTMVVIRGKMVIENGIIRTINEICNNKI